MAGRIPQHFIDQLVDRTDIVDLIDSFVPLKKAGANYKACCPFHDEKTPSFTVSPAKQFYHCFGCGANGSAIGFLMDYERLEFREAIERLASSAGLEMPTENRPQNQAQGKTAGIDLYDLLRKANEFYQSQLRQHAERDRAVDYLRNRGLSGEVAQHFGIGFAPPGWDNLMQSLASDEQSKKALTDTGMLSQNEQGKIYDRFRDRIMFPIHDRRGRIVGFGGRVLDDQEPKYLNSPETPIFHKGSELYGLYLARKSIAEKDSIIITEGYMDVVALAQAGIKNCVATLGTATTTMHIQRLLRFSHNLVFCFDGDRAGRAAAWKALETCLSLLQDGVQVSFLFLPDGEDPDSMVRKIGAEALLQEVKQATPLPDFLVDHLCKQADVRRLDGRARLIKLAQPLIQRLPQGVLRKLISDRLATLTEISADDIEPPTTASKRGASFRRGPSLSTTKPAPTTPTRLAISMLLQSPNLAQSYELPEGIEEAKIKGIDLLLELFNICQQSPGLSTGALLERFRQESYIEALKQLASYDHYEEGEQAFAALIDHIAAQHKENTLDAMVKELEEKATHQALSNEELNSYRNLLKEQSDLKKSPIRLK